MKKTAIILFLIAFMNLPVLATEVAAASKQVYYFTLDTEVHYGMVGLVKRIITKAKAEKVRAVILGINTFGGRVDAALEIIEHIAYAQPVPVYAFVQDKAWSAGALIALGCDAIYMRSGSSIGSATPVASAGTGKSEALGEKYVSAIRAKFRAVAEKNGYPPNLAAAMVDKDLEVWEAVVDGSKHYLTQEEINLAERQNKKVEIGPLITAKGKLLNLTAQQAQAYGLSGSVIKDLLDLLAKLELEDASIIVQKSNWTEWIAGFLTSSMISGLLLMVGLIALYTELSNPGFGWSGAIGITALGLLFWGKYIVNLAEMTELIIFAVGVILLLLEIFVIPGFGVAGIAGIILMSVALYLAFVPFVIPRYPWDMSLLAKTLLIMLVSILGSITGFLVLLHFLPEIPGMRRLVLTHEQRKEEGFSIADSSMPEMIGWQGVTATDLHPVGKAKFKQRILDVVAESGFIQKGATVTIIDVKGNRILVRAD